MKCEGLLGTSGGVSSTLTVNLGVIDVRAVILKHIGGHQQWGMPSGWRTSLIRPFWPVTLKATESYQQAKQNAVLAGSRAWRSRGGVQSLRLRSQSWLKTFVGEIYARVPSGSGYSRAVFIGTPPQHCMGIRDSAPGFTNRGGDPPH